MHQPPAVDRTVLRLTSRRHSLVGGRGDSAPPGAASGAELSEPVGGSVGRAVLDDAAGVDGAAFSGLVASALFSAGAFFAAVFFAVVFLVAAFFAAVFFAVVFLVTVFFAEVFLVAPCFAVDFLAAVFLAGAFFAVAFPAAVLSAACFDAVDDRLGGSARPALPGTSLGGDERSARRTFLAAAASRTSTPTRRMKRRTLAEVNPLARLDP